MEHTAASSVNSAGNAAAAIDSSGELQVLRIGTRKSQLAMAQTTHVRDLLCALVATLDCPVHPINTVGDKVAPLFLLPAHIHTHNPRGSCLHAALNPFIVPCV